MQNKYFSHYMSAMINKDVERGKYWAWMFNNHVRTENEKNRYRNIN